MRGREKQQQPVNGGGKGQPPLTAPHARPLSETFMKRHHELHNWTNIVKTSKAARTSVRTETHKERSSASRMFIQTCWVLFNSFKIYRFCYYLKFSCSPGGRRGLFSCTDWANQQAEKVPEAQEAMRKRAKKPRGVSHHVSRNVEFAPFVSRQGGQFPQRSGGKTESSTTFNIVWVVLMLAAGLRKARSSSPSCTLSLAVTPATSPWLLTASHSCAAARYPKTGQ